jgi:hypothetical protein
MPDIPASARARAAQFCRRCGLRVPIPMAPMARAGSAATDYVRGAGGK